MAEFRSILWRGGDETYAVDTAPHVRTDLNLDQIFTATGASAHEAVYCRTLEELDGALAALPSRSNGLRAWRAWLHDHAGAAPYRELAAGQHPWAFRRLEQHAERHRDFIAPAVARFDAELRFYLDDLRFVRELAEHGAPCCYPEVTTEFADIHAEDTYDAAPAVRLAGKSGTVVRNDFRLPGRERIIVVTGPDQGGKSAFARAFGQLFHLAALGCPVPGTRARAPLPDALFTHFLHDDDISDPDGAVAQELLRMRDIMAAVTPHSIVVLNESFSTTAAADALRIGGDVVRRIVDRGGAALYVTFLDELAEPGAEVVSMVAGATDNVQDFFRYLRTELAFYLGCLNLRERLGRTRTPICYPVSVAGTPTLRCDDLRDAALCLASDRVVGNDVDAAGVTFFVVSGANSDGKSTFLAQRRHGTADDAGRYVRYGLCLHRGPAQRCVHAFRARRGSGYGTRAAGRGTDPHARGHRGPAAGRNAAVQRAFRLHRRPRGRGDRRPDHVGPARLRREGRSGDPSLRLVRQRHAGGRDTDLFLRAQRASDCRRTYRVAAGAPEATSHGEDIYARAFGERLPGGPAGS